MTAFRNTVAWVCLISSCVSGLYNGIGSLLITVLELVCGCIVNLWLGWHVWDYSNMPFNLLGQICLPFTAIWFFLSAVAVVLDDWIRHILWKEKMPHYKLF